MIWIIIFSVLLLVILSLAVWNMSRASKDLKELSRQDDAHLLSELSASQNVLWICFLGGSLLTLNYAITYFSGSDLRMMPSWGVIEWSGAAIGAVVTIAITSVQMVLYRSTGNQGAALAVTALILIFVIISEVSAPMEKEDLKVRERSENSAVYQATVGAINRASTQAPSPVFSRKLAEAQAKLSEHTYELGRCNRYLETHNQKRVDRCANYENKKIAHYQGVIASLNSQMASQSQAGQSTALALVEKAKQLENSEQHHSPMVRFVRDLFGAPAIGAMALLSLILVTAFEAGFHFAGTRVGMLKAALVQRGNQDISMREQYRMQRRAARYRKKSEKLGIERQGMDKQKPKQNAPILAVPPMIATATKTKQTEQSKDFRNQSVKPDTQPSQNSQNNPETASKTADKTADTDEIESLYPTFKADLAAGKIKTTARGLKQYLSHHVRKTAVEIQEIADDFMGRAVAEGVAKTNPDYTPDNRKPKYLLV